MADLRAELEHRLAKVVAQRRSSGAPGYSFGSALIGYRRQCIENLRDSEDRMWAEQVRVLDEIAQAKGVPLYWEPNLRNVLEELHQRERVRRAEAGVS